MVYLPDSPTLLLAFQGRLSLYGWTEKKVRQKARGWILWDTYSRLDCSPYSNACENPRFRLTSAIFLPCCFSFSTSFWSAGSKRVCSFSSYTEHVDKWMPEAMTKKHIPIESEKLKNLHHTCFFLTHLLSFASVLQTTWLHVRSVLAKPFLSDSEAYDLASPIILSALPEP